MHENNQTLEALRLLEKAKDGDIKAMFEFGVHDGWEENFCSLIDAADRGHARAKLYVGSELCGLIGFYDVLIDYNKGAKYLQSIDYGLANKSNLSMDKTDQEVEVDNNANIFDDVLFVNCTTEPVVSQIREVIGNGYRNRFVREGRQ